MPATPQSEQTKKTINREEAQTELLATLSAARELGPDMDATLAGRYVDRLNELFPDPTRDSDRLRADVEALLVSVRGHGSDADAARASDFLKRELAPKAAIAPIQPAYAPAPQWSGPRASPAVIVPVALAAIAGVVALAVFAPHAIWLVFPLLFVFGGMFRQRGRRRYSRRFGPYDDYGPGRQPPGNGPEML